LVSGRNIHNILEPTTGVTFFNNGSKSDPTELFPSIVLVIASEKRFPPPNFNLKIVRTQRGSGSWMLLDALLHCWPALEECYVILLQNLTSYYYKFDILRFDKER
jgi:hypothetical protein